MGPQRRSLLDCNLNYELLDLIRTLFTFLGFPHSGGFTTKICYSRIVNEETRAINDYFSSDY